MPPTVVVNIRLSEEQFARLSKAAYEHDGRGKFTAGGFLRSVIETTTADFTVFPIDHSVMSKPLRKASRAAVIGAMLDNVPITGGVEAIMLAEQSAPDGLDSKWDLPISKYARMSFGGGWEEPEDEWISRGYWPDRQPIVANRQWIDMMTGEVHYEEDA